MCHGKKKTTRNDSNGSRCLTKDDGDVFILFGRIGMLHRTGKRRKHTAKNLKTTPAPSDALATTTTETTATTTLATTDTNSVDGKDANAPGTENGVSIVSERIEEEEKG